MADEQTEATAVLWEQSKAEAAQQDSDIDSLRTRAVALLSVGTLVGGLFGSRLPHGHLSQLAIGGLVAALLFFALSVGLAIAIAWPRSWHYGANRQPLIDGVAEGSMTLATVNLSLATRAEKNWEENHRIMRILYGLFACLCAVVGLQVVAWALAVV